MNNTIVSNYADYGGGMYCSYECRPVLINNILWDDSSLAGEEIYVTEPGEPVISYCDIEGVVWEGEGNINCDPVFCNPDSENYYLSDGSCCTTAGKNSSYIGARNIGCSYICGDASGNDKLNILDVTYIINYLYKGGPAPIPLQSADADGSGNINILDITRIINYLYKGGEEPVC